MKKKLKANPKKKLKNQKTKHRQYFLLAILIILAVLAITLRNSTRIPFFPNTGTANIAAGKVAHSTSWLNLSNSATQAVDGNQNTTWKSNHVLPASVTVYLDRPYSINQVIVKNPVTWIARRETIEVLGSSDNVNFTRIVAPISYTISPVITINFSPVTYKYIRLTISTNSQSDQAQVGEFEIYETAPTPVPSSTAPSKIIFGMGSQPNMNYRLVKESPVKMMTSWYNGPSDLVWMEVQKTDLIPRMYQNNFIVHLVTWTPDFPENNLQTPYGPACGRPYPVSTEVVDDMKKLAQIYNGSGPMYVTLFTEFPSFTCVDNNWLGNENYWNTMKDNYRKIKDNFHTYAPQSKVAISWGSWIVRYDDVLHQGGRSLFPHFADIMGESDFTAFQTMHSDTNVKDIQDMTRILGGYKKPVMVAHYKPGSPAPSSVFDADMNELFTDPIMSKLTEDGLFAFSFMDKEYLDKSETLYQLVKNGIIKYGK